MAARGHMSLEFEGYAKQPSALMHDVSYPLLGRLSSHHILDSHSSPDLLERKLILQGAEMEKLAIENQRLAATHVSLRRELAGTQLDLEKVRSYMGTMQAECDIESRGLLEEIARMEADLHTGESLHQNLQEAHIERKKIDASRQELSSEIQKFNEELLAARADLKSIPEMHAEIEGLKQEHQRLRASFEHEKGVNIEMVKHMHEMERNLVAMTKELEKLRAEVLNAEQRAQSTASNPYGNIYSGANYVPPYVGQGGVPSAVYAGVPQVQPIGGVPTEGMSPYGGHGVAAGPTNVMASGGWTGANMAGAPPPAQT